MDDEFKKDFDKRIYHPFLMLKSQYEVLREIPKHSDRELKDILVYEIWILALDGFIIRLDTFGKQFAKYFQIVKAQHCHRIKRNYYKEISEDPKGGVVLGESDPKRQDEIRKDMAIHFTKERREAYKKRWDKLFPSENSLKKGIPSTEDLDALIDKIRTIGQGISDHRDTISAHPDDIEPKPTTWKDVDSAMTFLEDLIGELGLAFFDISLGMEPGHMFNSPKTIGDAFVDLIYFEKEAGEQADGLEAETLRVPPKSS